jgi:hypothetical protein
MDFLLVLKHRSRRPSRFKNETKADFQFYRINPKSCGETLK